MTIESIILFSLDMIGNSYFSLLHYLIDTVLFTRQILHVSLS